ncbi:unnamed protein product [Bursaphelenchus okinawaensis]|uniref:MoaB/Mog domain-containing protein n=1 Tax=Bursaphelenchus okinawaensis TaxID=465554 RepID=A0A811L8M0_9BILA|nr:unnamed protein product [Bursaphelenchus okinawaensis]CAG9119067.1 unnamed protein product [Bursaphelenchus okinawaensis]
MTSVIHRPRQSTWRAISMDEAYQILATEAHEVTVEEAEFKKLTTGDIIAEEITAPWPHPRFKTSRMDGYAVKASDGVGDFKVLGGIVAGQSAKSLKIPEKHCFRINTGGIVPDDADSVVPVEYTKLLKHNETEELEIEISLKVTPGQNIREIGSDIKQDEVLIDKSAIISAPEMALLAANNYYKVKIYKRPVVGVISTGDELVDINLSNGKLQEGHILDSNRPMLIELVRSQGYECVDCGIVKDDRETLVDHIKKMAEKCDVLVFSGGVSMGDKDLLKPILQHDLNFDIKFGRVFMKPGLPNTFAVGNLHNRPIFVFGLPGNPVSAFVSSHLFLFPFLKRKSGRINDGCNPSVSTTISNLKEYSNSTQTSSNELKSSNGASPTTTSLISKITVSLGRDLKLDRRPEYARAVLRLEDGQCWADVLTTNQVSSRLLSVTKSNLLLELPPATEEKQTCSQGEMVKAIVIGPINT